MISLINNEGVTSALVQSGYTFVNEGSYCDLPEIGSVYFAGFDGDLFVFNDGENFLHYESLPEGWAIQNEEIILFSPYSDVQSKYITACEKAIDEENTKVAKQYLEICKFNSQYERLKLHIELL